MDIQKAIEIFRGHNKVKFILEGLGEREYATAEFEELVSAGEKQIPKKPTRMISNFFGQCANCKKIIKKWQDDAYVGSTNCCPECGQAIDWSDE